MQTAFSIGNRSTFSHQHGEAHGLHTGHQRSMIQQVSGKTGLKPFFGNEPQGFPQGIVMDILLPVKVQTIL